MKPARYRFGDYRLDTAVRELRRGDEPIALPAKSLECLAYLLEHHERAVGRDELIAAVWGRADAGDALLTQTIWRARRAVGDGQNGQNDLRTVPRFGYRWAAPVEIDTAFTPLPPPVEPIEIEVAIEPEPPAAIAPVAVATRRPRRLLAFAAGLVVLAAVLVAAFARRPLPTAGHAGTAPIVVLPVNLADASTDNAWLRFGAMDYVASRLRDARLGVMPSERVVAIAKPAPDASGPDAAERTRLARMTGAAHLLVPRAMRVDGHWRFAIDAYAEGGAHTYRADADTPLQAADRAAAQFLTAIGHAPSAAANAPGELDVLVQRIDAELLGGDLAEARQRLVEASAAQRGDARLQLRSGRVAFRGGRLEDAEAAFTPLAGGAADIPTTLRAQADLGLGGIAVRRRRFDEAEPHYTAALRLLGEQGDANLLGRAYSERAIVNAGLGRLDLAIADTGRARGELQRGGDPIGIAYADVNAALIAGQRGRERDALVAFDAAIATFERFGIVDGLATALANKANLQLGTLDTNAAAATSLRAWALLPRLEDRRLIEYVAQNHIRALRSDGRLAEAGRALDRFDGPGARSTDPAFAVMRAELLVDQGKAPLALQLGEDIVSRIEHAPVGSCGDTVPQAALALTEAALQSQRAEAAPPLLARLGEYVASQQDPDWTLASELARAQLLAANGSAEAERHFAAALAQAESAGEAAAIVMVAASYAPYLVTRADRTRAAVLVARLDPYMDRDYRAARAAAALHELLGEPAPAAAADGKARALAGERIARSP
jgi:DNA-binding winged helix-turn-helix (wHTH) protein/tetratricopeptide (TPR) repeat protein